MPGGAYTPEGPFNGTPMYIDLNQAGQVATHDQIIADAVQRRSVPGENSRLSTNLRCQRRRTAGKRRTCQWCCREVGCRGERIGTSWDGGGGGIDNK